MGVKKLTLETQQGRGAKPVQSRYSAAPGPLSVIRLFCYWRSNILQSMPLSTPSVLEHEETTVRVSCPSKVVNPCSLLVSHPDRRQEKLVVGAEMKIFRIGGLVFAVHRIFKFQHQCCGNDLVSVCDHRQIAEVLPFHCLPHLSKKSIRLGRKAMLLTDGDL